MKELSCTGPEPTSLVVRGFNVLVRVKGESRIKCSVRATVL